MLCAFIRTWRASRKRSARSRMPSAAKAGTTRSKACREMSEGRQDGAPFFVSPSADQRSGPRAQLLLESPVCLEADQEFLVILFELRDGLVANESTEGDELVHAALARLHVLLERRGAE